MNIQLAGISKRFGSVNAAHAVDLDIPSGQLVALLGPSGSGKTTLLRIIAGLERPDAGRVLIDGVDVTAAGVRERGVGFVFQHYALFSHLTVAENIAFGLESRPRAQRPSRPEIAARVERLLHLIRLENLGGRLPRQLSGGQRQRVALARALAIEPRVLLLDEPFGALDAQVREELRRWLRKLHDEVHVTSVFVTHDQEEALEVADRVVVLNEGRIEQQGTPTEVYRHPATHFVHRFLGNVNVFHGRSADGVAQVGDLSLPSSHPHPGSQPLVALVRPHDVAIARQRDAVSRIPARVVAVNAAGELVRVELRRDDDQRPIEARITHERQTALNLIAGDAVFIGFSEYRTYDPSVLPKTGRGDDYQI